MNVFKRVQDKMATSSNDWAKSEAEALCYAILVGWDDKAYRELTRIYNLTKPEIRVLRIANLLVKSEILRENENYKKITNN